MASVISLDSNSSIDYSIKDGEPREFIYEGDLLYSRAEGVEGDGWRKKLVEYVERYGLNKESPQFGGKNAFIYWMDEQGLLDA